MLQSEGFRKIDLIDIFDGGPVVSCQRDRIEAVRRTTTMQVTEVVASVEGSPTMLASHKGGFRAVVDAYQKTDSGCKLSLQVAQQLEVEKGEAILVAELHPPSSSPTKPAERA
jgi:arginine N-succinyltransferase